MNFSNLTYFIVLAEELNFTRAAQKLYITQQTLSGYIARLEKSLGTKLFERTTPITLTEAGQSLYRNALQLMQFQQKMEAEIQDIVDFRKSSLRIGITRDRSSCYVPIVLPQFAAKYPSVKLTLLEGTSEEITTALIRGHIDLSLGLPPKRPADIHMEKICEDRMIMIVPGTILDRYFPDRTQHEVFTLKSFASCPYLAIHHSFVDGAKFLQDCQICGFSPRIVLESKSMQNLIALCLGGMGILVCPHVYLFPYLHQQGSSALQKVKLFDTGMEQTARAVSANYLENKYLSKAASAFIQICKESLSAVYHELFSNLAF